MKKVLIIDASPRVGFCTQVANQITKNIYKQFTIETITLRNLNLNLCKGCGLCIWKGFSACVQKNDDIKTVLDKISASDGIIWVVPNYALSVPALLKNVFDRLSFIFHRPNMFSKKSLSIIVEGAYGGDKISKYINEVMSFWGMQCMRGLTIKGGLFPNKNEIDDKDNIKILKTLDIFINLLNSDKLKSPSLFKVIIFRMTRSSMKYSSEALEIDKNYYRKKGWLDSQYYYDVNLNPFKSLIGGFCDGFIKGMSKNK